MRLNARGAIHGLISLNLDGKALQPAFTSTAPEWLNAHEAIYQVQRAGVPGAAVWHLEAYDVDAGTYRLIDPGPATVVCAGGGVWAAWSSQGIRSNAHPAIHGAGLRGVGRDGTLGYCRSQQAGLGLILRATTGEEIEIAPTRPILDCHVYAYGVAAYTSGYRLNTVGTSTPVTVPEQVFQPRLVLVSWEWWVVYHTQDRLLLQPVSSPVGYVVHDGTNTFAPDAIEVSPGVVRVAWSTTEAEGPSSFRMRDVRMDAPRVPLTKSVTPPPPVKKRPVVTVTKFTGLMHPDGWEFAFYNSATPDAEHIRVFTKGGNMYAEMTNSAGTGRTGQARRVL